MFELPVVQGSGTMCMYAWKVLQINRDNTTAPCCQWLGAVSQEGSPLSVQDQSLEEIWNSEYMRNVRRAMVEGKPIPECATCYEREAVGGHTERLVFNQIWEGGYLNEEGLTIDRFRAQAIADNFRASSVPARVDLVTDNRCNLKCRMCYSGASSRIARDPVHSKWAEGPAVASIQEQWARNKRLFQGDLRDLRILTFVGGEPFLIKEIGDVLQQVIDAGVAPNVRILVVTNGTTTNAAWLKLVEKFDGLDLSISVDGFGPVYEYIRYPARWDTLVRNIKFFRGLPNTNLCSQITVQNYNVLSLVDLFRFLDSVDVWFTACPVVTPYHLQPTVLPPKARRLAAERLRSYADRECLPKNRETVLGLAAQLEAAGSEFDLGLMRQFMLFTNDLDQTRDQRFATTHPELLELIREAGFAWTSETRYAGNGGAELEIPPEMASDGSLDGVDAEEIVGWAWRLGQPNQTVAVDLYDGETLLATVPADQPRPDLKYPRAFRYPTPPALKDGKPHAIKALISGTGICLEGSPRQLTTA